MARIQPAPYPDPDDDGGHAGGRRRKAARYAVPVAVAGVAAATISLVPALADTGDPSLPSLTAQQLLTKIAASDTQTVDGTVKVTTDLGLPSALSGGAGSSLFGGAGPSGGGPGAGQDSPAAPQSHLTELLAGTHTLHVSADGQDRQKISLIEPAAEYSVIHNGAQLWAYDSASNQAYHQTLPQDAGQRAQDRQRPDGIPATPQAAAEQVLKAADGTSSITVAGTARVAGHSAYELRITPQHADRTTVGSIRIAVDSKTGVPLKFTLTPRGGGKAVFDIGFTKVGFGKPAASTFDFTPPKGVKVTQGGSAGADHRQRPDMTRGAGAQPTVLGKGWDSIAVITSPGGALDKTGKSGADGAEGLFGGGRPQGKGGGHDGGSLLNSFGKQVSGSFGTGTLFHTRLVNALLTDKGTLYVGAVTESALTDAAGAAAK
jgi:outer membrane lipoprotein-sorting protein